MTSFDFELIIDRDPTSDTDRLFEAFDPAGFTITPGVTAGTASIACYVEAADLDDGAGSPPTLDGAMRRAIALAEGCGFTVSRVEVEPGDLEPA